MNQENSSSVPHWAQRVDDFGKHRWNREKHFRHKRGDYIGAIIGNLIWLYIVNHLMDWNLQFITPHFPVVLWALNMNIFFQIAGNFLMLVLDIRFVKYLTRIILEAVSFLTLIILYYIYPFDFSVLHGWHFLVWLVPIALIIGMVVSAMKVISNIWKLIFWRN
jgi:hypothetical protein